MKRKYFLDEKSFVCWTVLVAHLSWGLFTFAQLLQFYDLKKTLLL